MSQIVPCVNTRCSYCAIRLPSVNGVSASASSVVVGRLPSNTRGATGRPLGLHLLARAPERERLGLREQVRDEQVVVLPERVQRHAKPMKSHGISRVPWWISW